MKDKTKSRAQCSAATAASTVASTVALTAMAALLLVGCEALPEKIRFPGMYLVMIQQGNLYDREDVQELQLGMSQSEVLEILGSPMIRDPLHKNRWDYLYLLKRGDEELKRHHLILYFEDDALREIIEKTPSPEPIVERATALPGGDASPSGR